MKLDDEINYLILFFLFPILACAILVLHLINRRWNNKNSDNLFPNASSISILFKSCFVCENNFSIWRVAFSQHINKRVAR